MKEFLYLVEIVVVLTFLMIFSFPSKMAEVWWFVAWGLFFGVRLTLHLAFGKFVYVRPVLFKDLLLNNDSLFIKKKGFVDFSGSNKSMFELVKPLGFGFYYSKGKSSSFIDYEGNFGEINEMAKSS